MVLSYPGCYLRYEVGFGPAEYENTKSNINFEQKPFISFHENDGMAFPAFYREMEQVNQKWHSIEKWSKPIRSVISKNGASQSEALY